MQFGNWLVSEEGITFNGDDGQPFVVPKEDLAKISSPAAGKPPMYHWVLEATDKEWLSHDDLYDFNYAFVFAAAKFGTRFDYSVFDDTLAEQYDLFELDEEEE